MLLENKVAEQFQVPDGMELAPKFLPFENKKSDVFVSIVYLFEKTHTL